MRWLFLLLLGINIGYVAWELNRDQPQQARSNAIPAGVERIVLLRELESAATEKAIAAKAPATQTKQESVVMPAAEEVASLQQSVANMKVDSLPRNAAPVNEAVVEDSKALTEERLAAVTDAPKIEPAVDLCYTLGPFSEMKTLRRVTREIKDYVVEASFRSKEEQEQTMFRVFVRPVGSKQEAKALIKELVSKNIRDYFIISDGPNKNGISLGYFSSKDRAYRHADHVRSLGFDATAEPVFRSYTIYWLDYRIKSGNEIPQHIVDEHLENSAQRLSRDCG